MSVNLVTAQSVPAKTGTALMARIRGLGGVLITNATMASVSYVLTDKTLGTQQDSQTLTGVIFDSLQQVPPWTKDSATALGPDGTWGYNFLYVVKAAVLTNGGNLPVDALGNPVSHRMRADVIMTPVTGEPFRIPFEFSTIPVFG